MPAEELLERVAVPWRRDAEASLVYPKGHPRQLPSPRNPVTKQRADDLLAGAVRRRVGMRTDHRNPFAALFQDEFAVAVDHTHVSLRAAEHVSEGIARAEEETPKSGELQRQRPSKVDTQGVAGILEDRP